jgi:hypothetical protein
MGCTVDQWAASATGSGSDRVITVRGKGECTGGGYELCLKPTNEGVIDQPDTVALRLVVEEPEVATDVMTPVAVETQIYGDPAIKVRVDTTEESYWIEVAEA